MFEKTNIQYTILLPDFQQNLRFCWKLGQKMWWKLSENYDIMSASEPMCLHDWRTTNADRDEITI
jgi:hypothetical protein